MKGIRILVIYVQLKWGKKYVKIAMENESLLAMKPTTLMTGVLYCNRVEFREK